MLLSGNVAAGVVEVGSLFPRIRISICKTCQQSAQDPIARARFALTAAENFWKIRSANCAPDCSESSVSQKKTPKTPMFGVAQNRPHSQRCVNVGRFGWRSCYAGLQPAVTKRNGTGARSKALNDAATPLASRIAAGSC